MAFLMLSPCEPDRKRSRLPCLQEPHRRRFPSLLRRGLGHRARVNDDGHRGLFDDDLNLRARLDPAVTADWRTERHHRRGPNVLQSFRQHRVGIDVGKNRESLPGPEFLQPPASPQDRAANNWGPDESRV